MIVIKNFQMPDDCSTCLFCVKRKTSDYGYYGSCYINNEDGINLLNHTRDSECPLIDSVKPIFEEFREKLNKWMFYNSESVCGDNMIDIDYLNGHMDELAWELGIYDEPEQNGE